MDFKKNVKTWFLNNRLVFWRLLNAGGEVVAKVIEETATEDEALARLEANLQVLPEGLYKILGKQKKGDTNGEIAYNFYVPPNEEPKAKVTGANDYVAELEKKLAKTAEALREKEEEERIRKIDEKWQKKFEKWEEEQNSKNPDMLERLLGVFNMVNMAKGGGAYPQPAAAQPQGNVTGTPEKRQSQETQIVQTALSQMRTIFADDNSFLAFLQNAGNIAQHEPQKFMLLLQYMQPPKQPQNQEQDQD
jgi:hypothetical protein